MVELPWESGQIHHHDGRIHFMSLNRRSNLDSVFKLKADTSPCQQRSIYSRLSMVFSVVMDECESWNFFFFFLTNHLYLFQDIIYYLDPRTILNHNPVKYL